MLFSNILSSLNSQKLAIFNYDMCCVIFTHNHHSASILSNIENINQDRVEEGSDIIKKKLT